MKIKVNNKTFELTDVCKFEIKNNLLFNKNTNKYEGVDGDEAIIKTDDGEIITGTVQGYTCYQFITLDCFGDIIISSTYTVTYKHKSKVELVD